jgi:hypothetical protein
MVLPSRLAEGLSANTLLNVNMYECMYHTWVVFYNGSGQSDVISFLFFSHSNSTYLVRFQVLTAASMKFTVS